MLDRFIIKNNEFLNDLKEGSVYEFSTNKKGFIVFYDKNNYYLRYKNNDIEVDAETIIIIYNYYKNSNKPFEIKTAIIDNELEDILILKEVKNKGYHGVILNAGTVADIGYSSFEIKDKLFIFDLYWNTIEPQVNGSMDKKAIRLLKKYYGIEITNKELTNIITFEFILKKG